MKLKDLKNPSSFKQEIPEHVFLEILKEKAKNSHVVMTKTPLFIDGFSEDIALINPIFSKKIISKFWIDEFINQSQSWKKFPSREHCIRTFTDRDRLDDDPHVVIPFDRSKLGVSLKSSFYKSFSEVERSLDLHKVDNSSILEWINSISTGIKKLTDLDLSNTVNNFVDLNKFLKSLDNIINDNKGKILKNLKDQSISLTTVESKLITDLMSRFITSSSFYLSEKLDPETNGFKLVSIESFNEIGDHEVWISSPCLIIKRSKYIDLYKREKL